jgi:hypothetical protein
VAGESLLKNPALEKSSFQVMIAPLAPILPLLGAGAHYDVSVLPEPRNFSTIA